MKKIYVSPRVAEFATGVEVGFCGSTASVYVDFSENSKYDSILGGED